MQKAAKVSPPASFVALNGRPERRRPRKFELLPRSIQRVVLLKALGFSDVRVAELLEISYTTVKSYLADFRSEAGCSSTLEAMLRFDVLHVNPALRDDVCALSPFREVHRA